MSFKLPKKNIMMDTNDQGRVVPFLLDGKDGKSKFLKVRLYNQFIKDIHYSESVDGEMKKGPIVHNGEPKMKANIDFLLPHNAVDFSGGDLMDVSIDNEKYNLAITIDMGWSTDENGEKKHEYKRAYNVPLQDIVQGMYQPPVRLRINDKMVNYPKNRDFAYVSFIEDGEKKQFVVPKRAIRQTAIDMQYGNVELNIYSNNKYKVYQSVKTEELDDKDQPVFKRVYENNGEGIRGEELISRIEKAKEQYRNSIQKEQTQQVQDIQKEQELDELEI